MVIPRREMAKYLVLDWLGAECELGATNNERAGALWDSWRAFARVHHDEPGSPADFAETMERRGYTIDQLVGERHRIRWGLRLKCPP